MKPEARQRTPLCPDCSTLIGEEHSDGCDVARCLTTGGQRFSCGCGECGNQRWGGVWPGKEDAARLGFWCTEQAT